MDGSVSFRGNNSNVWRNTGIEVFSKSSREEDDEEALKWAALEKLPTFDRLRKGLLFGSKGASEINVNDLGLHDKRSLVERLVTTVEDDNEKFLQKLRSRMDRVGIDIPTIEVRFEHLNVDAEASSASSALPTFLNFNVKLIEEKMVRVRSSQGGEKTREGRESVEGNKKSAQQRKGKDMNDEDGDDGVEEAGSFIELFSKMHSNDGLNRKS